MPDAWVVNPSTYKNGETTMVTAYGGKSVNIYEEEYDYAHRTTYAPDGCFIPFKYGVDDYSGNYVVWELSSTSIAWIQNTG